MKAFLTSFFLLFFLAVAFTSAGHPMPHSTIEMNIGSNSVLSEIRIPLKELQFAVPFDVTDRTDILLRDYSSDIAQYLRQHIQIQSVEKALWSIQITKLELDSTEQEATGKYLELAVYLHCTPPPNSSTRQFTLYYNAVVHQLVTHKIFVAINNDFVSGRINKSPLQLGVISADPADNSVDPIEVNLDNGSAWTGFKEMIFLGVQHIWEGTDHLLFLLMLLLPSSLLAIRNRWADFRGTRASVIHVLKLVTAFTVGHSLSLMLGALDMITLPTKPVEVGIAATIFFTAIHAIRPLFPNKEVIVASGFGIVHGLAFSSVLTELNLHGSDFTIALLGFNLGIEFMQIFLIIAALPWMLMLSPHTSFKIIRIALAVLAMIASIGWALERIEDHSNMISQCTDKLSTYFPFLLAILATVAIATSFLSPKKTV